MASLFGDLIGILIDNMHYGQNTVVASNKVSLISEWESKPDGDYS